MAAEACPSIRRTALTLAPALTAREAAVSLSDELIAARRREAAAEDAPSAE